MSHQEPASRPDASPANVDVLARPPKGHLTLRIAAVLFIVSAAFEVFSLTSPVPLFGAMRDGGVAVLVHLLDTALFAGMGVGIFTRQRWGYLWVFAATAVYSLEKVLYVLDRRAREAEIAQSLRGLEEFAAYIDKDAVQRLAALTALLFVFSAWGFAGYVYARRAYFRADS